MDLKGKRHVHLDHCDMKKMHKREDVKNLRGIERYYKQRISREMGFVLLFGAQVISQDRIGMRGDVDNEIDMILKVNIA